MQNFDEGAFAPAIVGEGVIPLPAGDGAEAFVDVRDIAAVAAATLRDPGAHAGAEYTITGPEALTLAQVAEVIGEATGRAIAYVDVPPEQWVEGAAGAGLPRDYAELLATLLGVIRSGHGATPEDTVERVTGRPPIAFRDYARGAAEAWRTPAAL